MRRTPRAMVQRFPMLEALYLGDEWQVTALEKPATASRQMMVG